MEIMIAPSLLSADFGHLAEQIRLVEDAGAGMLHVDVMDGHFVPNITIGPVVVRAIRRVARVPLDVHLMIADPGRYVEAFVKAGADRICYHVESDGASPELADRVRAMGASPAVTLRPGTPLERIGEHLDRVDMVMVMSVEPGFSGQSFMPEVLDKTKALRDVHSFAGDVEMDGGVGEETIAACARAGANVFVAGSAVFGAPDPAAAVKRLRAKAEGAAGFHR